MGTGLHKMDMFAGTETETGDGYKCIVCGTSRPPTVMLNNIGKKYLFCGVCKEVLADSVKEQEVDIRINYYYDESKKYAIIKMEDWERILKLLQEGGAELHRS